MAYVTLRNISGEPLSLGVPGAFGARTVDPDEVIRVEGTMPKDQPEDAVLIGSGDDARAYPTSLWAKVATGKTGEPDVAAPSEGNA